MVICGFVFAPFCAPDSVGVTRRTVLADDSNCRPSRSSQPGRNLCLHVRSIGLLLGSKATPGPPGPRQPLALPASGHPGTCLPRCHSRVRPRPLILLTAKEPPAGQAVDKNLSRHCPPASSMAIIDVGET